MNSCAIGVAVQCRSRRHFLPSLSPATEHAKLVYAAAGKDRECSCEDPHEMLAI